MRYSFADSKRWKRNREKLMALLPQGSAAVLVSSDEMPRNGDQCFPFRQDSDLFYLTGISQPNTALVLFPGHPNPGMRVCFFANEPDPVKEIWYGHQLTKEEIRSISGIETVQWMAGFEDFLREVALRSESLLLNVNEYLKFRTPVPVADQRFALHLRSQFPALTIERLAPLLTRLRLIKEDWEVEMIHKAGKITEKAFYRLLSFTKRGLYEYELEAEITHEFIRSGAEGHAYAPIIACGPNACILHYTTNANVCKDGDLILLDFGAELGNYAADLSRTIPVNGRFSNRQRQVYEAVLRIYQAMIPEFVPGRTLDQLQELTIHHMNRELINLGLFSQMDLDHQDPARPLYQQYYMHGLSHFIGLDVHDPGTRQIVLEEGMVVSCEPGIYVQNEGIGVRIETDVRVGIPPVDLLADIPVTIDEIENLMKKS